MNMKKTALILALVSSTMLAGCADPYSGSVYRADQAKQAQSVDYGVITRIRPVEIDGHRGIGVGSVGGAVLGGIAGSTVGGGTGRYLGAAAGALGGGVLGNAIENRATRQKGIEIDVRLERGQTISVVQSADEAFSVGQRVRVIGSGSSARVTH